MLRTVALFAVRNLYNNKELYFVLFWSLAACDYLLQLALIVEIGLAVLRPSLDRCPEKCRINVADSERPRCRSCRCNMHVAAGIVINERSPLGHARLSIHLFCHLPVLFSYLKHAEERNAPVAITCVGNWQWTRCMERDRADC